MTRETTPLKADLHTHSYFSDGSHAPGYVLEQARQNGVTHLALTDHDCIDGYLQAADDYQDGQPALIPGVEISTLWNNLEIHVLGLCFNPSDQNLKRLLDCQQQRRRERLQAIEAKLVKAGIIGLGDYIRDLPCVSPGRAHVARFLAGQTRSTARKAFRSLARNGRFHVAAAWSAMDSAVSFIRQAGGIAVLAHPHRYPLNRRKLSRLLEEFHAAGGEGLEICCSNMAANELENLAALSLEHGLWASAGSDFHTSEATWMDIGRLQQLPESVKKNAIWSHPRWHFPDHGGHCNGPG